MLRAAKLGGMDRNIDVRTPESIAFRYDLAGLGSRFIAVIIDTVIQIVVLLLILWGIASLGAHVGSKAGEIASDMSNGASRFAESVAIAIVIFIIFTIFYGYFIIFEAFWNGQTPGKRILGIRVVRDGGYPLDFAGSLVRNLVRIIEMALGYYVIAAISALISPENKRVGDYAAGTIVVRESKVAAPATLREVLAASAERHSSAYLSDEERALVSGYLMRRYNLDDASRRELAAQLAQRVRDRAPADLRNLDDDELLERI